jgi:hypothetical protein
MSEAPPKTVDVSRRKGRSARRYVIVILLLLVLLPIGLFVAAPFWRAYQADAGFKKAKKTIDPKQLLDWEQKIVTKYPFTNQTDDMLVIPRTEIPEQLQKLYARTTPTVVIFRNDNELPYVRVIWGGGFFGWHISIGRTNTLTTNDFGYWTQGVYYNRQ